MNEAITIGELAKRSGVAASAIRFYEEQGLIHSTRTEGGQRQYRKETLRRVGFIRAAQTVGLNLSEIRSALETLPGQRTPTKRDWERLFTHVAAFASGAHRPAHRIARSAYALCGLRVPVAEILFALQS